ncbi:hypothetical protein HELRODRAFT_178006 [Helobdella robusta]|uniref:Uncharacterized protein n=1 Tax=Helobdella robusta TaxID=6412 RepID=T1FCL4_HELRO|nr:hypothetical protein HELRODRAFT_178006 [Helobdella robusta]ESN97572.1 hypothetical protein HELRODRAFT_178006 [Helobdella robusta]
MLAMIHAFHWFPRSHIWQQYGPNCRIRHEHELDRYERQIIGCRMGGDGQLGVTGCDIEKGRATYHWKHVRRSFLRSQEIVLINDPLHVATRWNLCVAGYEGSDHQEPEE